MAKSLMELIQDYGKAKWSSGWDGATADSFEGDSQAVVCRRQEERSERRAAQILERIRKLLGT